MRLKLAAVLPAFLLAVPAVLAQTESGEFTVGDIRIEGLQRITEGTVYNYLPVNIGDRLDNRRVDEALRALYATGFFRDVEIRRDGGTLVVAVLERPSIESFTITGNKDIKTEDLEKSLRNVGLSRGKTFNQSTLDEVERFLTDQYFSRGKYAVQVDTKVEEVAGNRVKIAVDIVEGKRSKIRQINIVGNEAFSDDDLLEDFKLRTPNWLSWYKQDDRYSREELSGDIEKLRSYYLDRGYANMDVETTQVAITPEKDDIFITLNVKEGDVYRISDVKIAGNLVVPEEQLKALVAVRRGDVFSRKMVTATTELMQLRLGQDGYAFAKIDPVPKENPATKEIELTFLVDPGNRAYVRNIGFTGSTGINDDVLRREIRQMEGGYLSNAAVDRSKIRLQRLPFIEKVEVETNPVPGTPDLVDVTYDIKEGLPGQFSGGIGYSESQSILLNGSFVHSNFMGTGNRVAAEINAGQYSKVFSLSHTDPYTSIDGVSRTVSAAWRSISQFTRSSSDFQTETGTLGLDYAWPISEFQSVRMGLAAQRSDLFTDPNSSAAEALYWVQNNGNTYTQTQSVGIPPIAFTYYGTKFDTFEYSVGWSFDSRNRAMFADRGGRHRLSASYTLPGSDIDFVSINYDYLQFIPMGKWFTLMFNSEAGYGQALGDTTSMPPYRRFFAGGPETVRGFRESRLGPRDSFGNPYGGNIKFTNQLELLLPMPAKWKNSARFSLFVDAGNVFSNDDVAFVGRDGVTPVSYEFAFDKLRYSTGVAVQWLAPLGVFRFSYAVPLNEFKGTAVEYPDETEGFQFSIGQAF
ncbi:MAG: outer membrane protein assembly factor BamA [Gammaproteobacteria bacterium]|nr:outer membrane protein assembly factor BamA [Gammaproteobacteria bacterium]MDH4312365.1 outer membrane protein assembly factor BamA [Gammaproteobacteria bacterium]MDH5271968.1 outer membrane protein assembly factor BamA [Gammaproteobacteria bacterium]